MQRAPDVIGRYAGLTVQRDIYTAKGHRVPSEITTEIAALEAHARAVLSPQQLAGAMHQANLARAQVMGAYHATQTQRAVDDFDKDLEKLSRSITKGVAGRDAGLTPNEFRELNETGKLTIKNQRLSQPERDGRIRELTRRFDPSGKGFTEAEWAAKLDALADAPTDAHFGHAATGLHAPTDTLKELAKDWESGPRLEYGLRKRFEAKTSPPKDEVRTMDDSDHRKMSVANAYLAVAEKNPSVIKEESPAADWAKDEPPDSIRGAMARAYEKHSADTETQENAA